MQQSSEWFKFLLKSAPSRISSEYAWLESPALFRVVGKNDHAVPRKFTKKV